MNNIVFAKPWVLYFLLIIIPLLVWYYFTHRSVPTVQISSTAAIEKMPASIRQYLRHILFALRLVILCLFIIILARPQTSNSWENISTQGIDIVLAIDVSTSMLAQDLKPDRLEASKDVAIEFISGRPNDRIGLVIFSSESYTQCPLTTDHSVLINLFKDVKSGVIEDGTAIGVGLATAINRLKDSDAISKVIILLTDGVNNQGAIDPITAAEFAKTFNIRVYTVGVGTEGEAPYPYQDMFGRYQLISVPVEIDEEVLQQISDVTNGRYFRATNNDKLRQIYAEIDKLEKSKINVREFSRKEEEYLPFAIAAFVLLIVEFILRRVFLRTVP